MNTKDVILRALEAHRGGFVSGEQLAEETGVSRSAIWKSVSALKAEGVEIVSKVSEGYMLPLGVNALSVEGIRRYYEADDLDIRIVRKADSSNNYLKQLAGSGEKEGAVVFVLEQTGGKGRLGRKFFSPIGSGIYFSILTRPSLEVAPLLTVLAAVAVAQGIEDAGGAPTKIKWVNDVYSGGKKCCGILTEAVADLESGGIEYAVVGIGVNVTTPKGGFPTEIENIASAALDGVADARNKAAACILKRFWDYYKNFDKERITKIYREKSFVVGRNLTVIKGEKRLPARAVDMDENCRLVVEYESGERETLTAGEVSLKL